ncbi:MAG: hypothetical protein ACKOHI_13690 [Phycisphaerales bacterium]
MVCSCVAAASALRPSAKLARSTSRFDSSSSPAGPSWSRSAVKKSAPKAGASLPFAALNAARARARVGSIDSNCGA